MQWTTTKPSEPCVFIAANKYRDQWNHEVYELKYIDYGEGEYLACLTGDGEEWGDIADLSAEEYLILPKHVD